LEAYVAAVLHRYSCLIHWYYCRSKCIWKQYIPYNIWQLKFY